MRDSRGPGYAAVWVAGQSRIDERTPGSEGVKELGMCHLLGWVGRGRREVGVLGPYKLSYLRADIL